MSGTGDVSDPADRPSGQADDELVAFLDDVRVDDAAGRRARQRALARQESESARLVGVLRSLAEHRVDVRLRTIAGRLHRGEVVGVGLDFCVLRSEAHDTYVALGALAWIRPAVAQGTVVADDRGPTLDLSLAELFSRLSPEEPDVALAVTGDDELLVGRLEAAGIDVLRVRLDGPAQARCYVGMSSVTEAVVTL